MRVYSHTTVHNGEESYRLAIVESERGERRTVRLPDELVAVESVEIGDWLELPQPEARDLRQAPGDDPA